MTREQFLYVYAHANSLAELALKAAMADADAWMEVSDAGSVQGPAEEQSAAGREAAESRALENAFDGLDMNALDGLPFFGAELAEASTQMDEPAQIEPLEAAAAAESSAERQPPTKRQLPTEIELSAEPKLPAELQPSANANAEDRSKPPVDDELTLYLDQVYGKIEAIQQQSDTFLASADTKELQAILDRQDRNLPAIDTPWSGADLNVWLERYLASDRRIDELIVWIRSLDSSLD